jgi:hypothetical protein
VTDEEERGDRSICVLLWVKMDSGGARGPTARCEAQGKGDYPPRGEECQESHQSLGLAALALAAVAERGSQAAVWSDVCHVVQLYAPRPAGDFMPCLTHVKLMSGQVQCRSPGFADVHQTNTR